MAEGRDVEHPVFTQELSHYLNMINDGIAQAEKSGKTLFSCAVEQDRGPRATKANREHQDGIGQALDGLLFLIKYLDGERHEDPPAGRRG